MPSNILIVEDNHIIALDVQKQLESFGFEEVNIALSGEAALNRISKVRPGLILMDVNLKGKINGLQTAETIKKWFNLPVIFITAYLEEEISDQAEDLGDGFLKKPFTETDLKHAINKVFQN